ncbi:prohormone-4 [Caerostris extrusa]|uniref:Prohormone-4 n=1 Tax=Caerostris extrusa TaxID=172846 RepID=A0AAV4VWJ7_CAEEX|nr:prohormone-4 [Caerostris extrusa]
MWVNRMHVLFPAKRPPVEETANFLQALLANHGPNYLEKLFGSKARDALAPLGGVNQVAVALSESETLDDFWESSPPDAIRSGASAKRLHGG